MEKATDRSILCASVHTMASFQIRLSKKSQGLAIKAFILIVFIFASYFLTIRLISQFYYHKAMNHVREGYYLPAAEDLEKALYFQPDYPAAWREIGRAYGNLADLSPVDEAFPMAEKSKQACLMAVILSPFDGQAAFYLAMAEARLEFLYARLQPDPSDNPYHPLLYFQQAIRLRPNSLIYHYSLAQYLYRQRKNEGFQKTIRKLTRLYPPIYGRLKKEAFWSPAVLEEVKKGIMQAIKKGNEPGKAHSILARILEQEKDWAGAITHFQKAMAYKTDSDPQKDYFNRLGRLFLRNGQPQEAKQAFLDALKRSDAPAKDLEGVFSIFKKTGFIEELPGFYEEVRNRFSVSGQMDILFARSLFHAGMVDQARSILNEENRKEPSAEAYYWLARIAEREKDMVAMKNAIAQATALDPRNSGYHLLFSQVLARMGKLVKAEKEAGLAIRYADKPSSRLFIHRANILLRGKDYLGAVKDLESAIALKPNSARYYAKAAETYEKGGKLSNAIDYYEKAVKLAPENKGYQNRYQALREKRSKTF
jgi:tetratricopeptide (TPR) repeat protein